jgi:hypothetical protein
MSGTRFRSGLLNLTQLDLTGPYEVLARLPGAETPLLWKSPDPVRSEHGLTTCQSLPWRLVRLSILIRVPRERVSIPRSRMPRS